MFFRTGSACFLPSYKYVPFNTQLQMETVSCWGGDFVGHAVGHVHHVGVNTCAGGAVTWRHGQRIVCGSAVPRLPSSSPPSLPKSCSLASSSAMNQAPPPLSPSAPAEMQQPQPRRMLFIALPGPPFSRDGGPIGNRFGSPTPNRLPMKDLKGGGRATPIFVVPPFRSTQITSCPALWQPTPGSYAFLLWLWRLSVLSPPCSRRRA